MASTIILLWTGIIDRHEGGDRHFARWVVVLGVWIDAERKRGPEAGYGWNVYGQSMWLLLNFGRIHRQSCVFLFLPTVTSDVFDAYFFLRIGRPVLWIAKKGITMIFLLKKKKVAMKYSHRILRVLNQKYNRFVNKLE